MEGTSAMKDVFLPTAVPRSVSLSCITGYSVLSFVKIPYALEGLIVSNVAQINMTVWTFSLNDQCSILVSKGRLVAVELQGL